MNYSKLLNKLNEIAVGPPPKDGSTWAKTEDTFHSLMKHGKNIISDLSQVQVCLGDVYKLFDGYIGQSRSRGTPTAGQLKQLAKVCDDALKAISKNGFSMDSGLKDMKKMCEYLADHEKDLKSIRL